MAYATSTVLTYLALGATVASTAVSIYGQQEAKESAEEAAAYNANLARQEALNKERENAEQIRRQRQRDKQARARLRATLATRGTVTTSGTPLALQTTTAANQDLAIQDALRASSIETAAIRSGSAMGLWEANQNSAAANLQSIGTGLSGIATATGQAYRGYNSGALGTTRTGPTP